MSAAASSRPVTVTVNGGEYEREVEARKLLIHFVRDDLDLTGSHIGCNTGNCGACTMIVDGQLVKSCMLLAVQADGKQHAALHELSVDDHRAGAAIACIAAYVATGQIEVVAHEV